MKARKIAAVILAVLVLVSCMPVLGESAVEAEATVQVTSAPVQITPAPSEIPAEEATEQPVMPMSETAEDDEVTPAPEATDEATEAPATEIPATEVPSTEAPATEVPATEVPATEAPATDAPATEAPVYAPVYAKIPADTELFADKELTEILGELTGSEILYVVEKNAEQRLYMAAFDTEETIETDSVEIAWFTIEAEAVIEWLTEEEAAAAVETMTAYRKANGDLVPYIAFEYAETETDEADEPETDESGLIIETLVAVEPETESAPEATPEVDENGMIVEELAPVEETPAEEAPIEETPAVEETPAEEIPAEETPVEEIPAVEDEEIIPDEEIPAVEDEEIIPTVEDVLIDETEAAETVVETESEETAAPECSVIATMYGSSETVALGDTITVKAELIGYEGLNYTCEWECAVTDETGAVVGEWQSTGITDLEHSFVLDETNVHVAWRLRTVVEA